jgi:isopentenyl-diphosphate delta-isomerase
MQAKYESYTKEANSQRKREHLDIVLNGNPEFDGVKPGLDEYWFVHQALPEIDLASVDLSTNLFGKTLDVPLFISSMVGGIEPARRINHNLASAAQALGVAMGVGSQRCAIEDQSAASTYQVRDVAPDILLFANLGAVQLNHGYSIAECRRAVEMIDADGLMLHLNPLHEALQHDGNTDFTELLPKIKDVCCELTVPVVIKEVGHGISEDTARSLSGAGVAGIDVAGAGGTAWSEVERHRVTTDGGNRLAATFASWGIPTADSILMSRRGAPDLMLIASGGIRTGLDVAKAVALGSDAAGIAAPLLRAANDSTEAVIALLQQVIQELKVAMFCIGAANIVALKNSPFLRKRSGLGGSVGTGHPTGYGEWSE